MPVRKISSSQSVRVTSAPAYTSGLAKLGSDPFTELPTALAHTSQYCRALSMFGRFIAFWTPIAAFTFTRILPASAFRVVIRMTPLDPTDAP